MESKKFRDLGEKTLVAKVHLIGVQDQLGRGFNPDLVSLERNLTSTLKDLWQKDAMFWHQRSHIKWL